MFYTATVKVFFEDDKGRRKARKENYLVNAETVSDVEHIVHEDFRGTMNEFEVVRVGKSNVVDVLNFTPKETFKASKPVTKTDEFSEI
jgi:hypothetical protein